MTTYLVFSVAIFAIMAIIAGREIKADKEFKPMPTGGVLNLLYYYQYCRHNRKPISVNFWLFIAAHLNLLVCALIFVYLFITR